MRSLVRYSLIALGVVALAITVVTFRPQLEQKTNAQFDEPIPGCNQSLPPSAGPNVVYPDRDPYNPCLVISSFRENGPNGTGDEFVEIFNASEVDIDVKELSDDPGTSSPAVDPGDNGIGVFASQGQGTASNVVSLACQIPGGTIIEARSWFLCGGTAYSLDSLGKNGGAAVDHYEPDAIIGDPLTNAVIDDIPDDAGLALLNIGSNIINACVPTANPGPCPSGFNYSGPVGQAVVMDKVGFQPWGSGAPANTGGGYPGNIYPSLSTNYCEGRCLQPIGDASVTVKSPGGDCEDFVVQTAPEFPEAPVAVPTPATFLVEDGGFITNAQGGPTTLRRCYGESGQYKIERRRNQFILGLSESTGDLHRDSNDNADDFILDSPNPSSTNIGQGHTGVPAVFSVLGTAAPHSQKAPPILTKDDFTNAPFDSTVGQLGPRNAERRYPQDPNIDNTGNDPLGTFLLRLKYTNNSGALIAGAKWRIDDLSMLCGNQFGNHGVSSLTATQSARTLRGPNQATGPFDSPTPTCQEAPLGGGFTAILKAVNHNAQSVVDGGPPAGGVARFVHGSVLEDAIGAPAVPGQGIQPWGGGSNSAWVANPSFGAGNLGPDGVSHGTGVYATPILTGATIRIAFKFGVVRSGRFILLVGVEGE